MTQRTDTIETITGTTQVFNIDNAETHFVITLMEKYITDAHAIGTDVSKYEELEKTLLKIIHALDVSGGSEETLTIALIKKRNVIIQIPDRNTETQGPQQEEITIDLSIKNIYSEINKIIQNISNPSNAGNNKKKYKLQIENFIDLHIIATLIELLSTSLTHKETEEKKSRKKITVNDFYLCLIYINLLIIHKFLFFFKMFEKLNKLVNIFISLLDIQNIKEDLEKQLSEIYTQIQTLMQEKTTITRDTIKLNKEKEELQIKVDELNTQLTTGNKDVSKLKKIIKAYTDKLKEYETNIQNNNTSLSENATKINSLESEKYILQKDIDSHRERFREIQTRLKTAESEHMDVLKYKDTRIQALEDEVTDNQEQIERLLRESTNKEEKIKMLESNIQIKEEQNTRLLELEQLAKEHPRKLAELYREIEDQRQQINRLSGNDNRNTNAKTPTPSPPSQQFRQQASPRLTQLKLSSLSPTHLPPITQSPRTTLKKYLKYVIKYIKMIE
jgi:predicted  nucleic acid-binding Zn-ribbon protein